MPFAAPPSGSTRSVFSINPVSAPAGTRTGSSEKSRAAINRSMTDSFSSRFNVQVE